MSSGNHKFPPPPPPPTKVPRSLYFATRVLPIFFALGAVQIAVTNYFFPITEEQQRELDERRQGKGFASSRLAGKENIGLREKAEQILSHDDSQLLSADNLKHIDLSHLDQPVTDIDSKSQ